MKTTTILALTFSVLCTACFAPGPGDPKGECTIENGGCPDGETCVARDDGTMECRKLCVAPVDCPDETCLEGVCHPAGGERCPNGFGDCHPGYYCGDSSHTCLRYPIAAASTCDDGVRGESGGLEESDADCGGPCSKCTAGSNCFGSGDCVSNHCVGGTCQAATCTDEVINGGESDEDCGQVCPTGCADGLACVGGTDCASGLCFDQVCGSCEDTVTNGGETDLNCGGPDCGPCADGESCLAEADCASGICEEGRCVSCEDGTLNNGEGCIDGGGSCPTKCTDDQSCNVPADCFSGFCEQGGCVSCVDETVNNQETDEDCGGPNCPDCPNSSICVDHDDCIGDCVMDSGAGGLRCNQCGDGVVRGSETCEDVPGNTEREYCDDSFCGAGQAGCQCTVCGPTCTLIPGMYCGDNVKQEPEFCDDGNDSSDEWKAERHCTEDCKEWAPHCGDGTEDPQEECGDGSLECMPGDTCGGCKCTTLPPAAPVLSVAFAPETLRFSWDGVPYTNFYRLFEDPDGLDVYSQIADGISVTSHDHRIPVHLRAAARYRVDACNDVGCTASEPLEVGPGLVGAIGYFKASNTGGDDEFGYSVALSNDGNTLAVGARREKSSATGTGGADQDDNSAIFSGAVYVFVREGVNWAQQAYVKASNTGAGDHFGCSVALGSDGNTLAVGARGEDSNTTGTGGAGQDDDSAGASGAVYVFVREGADWAQQAYVKASNTGENDYFGYSVALGSDGNTLAVGAPFEDSITTGTGGAGQDDDTAGESGAVYVLVREGVSWSQQAYVKASNTGENDYFGYSVALGSDGNTLAVGAYGEASNTTGTGGAGQDDDTAGKSGAVYVFVREGVSWAQQAYVKASNTGGDDEFGYSVALSSDGSTLAVGARGEASSATGTGGAGQDDDSAGDSGAVYVFVREGVSWAQQAYVKASNTGADDQFGYSVALGSDGNTLAVGARGEDSNTTGTGGAGQDDDSAGASGAVYVFVREGVSWAQQAYVKASNTGADDQFGYSVALGSDGNTLAVGAYGEASNTTGTGGAGQDDNSAFISGAVYLF